MSSYTAKQNEEITKAIDAEYDTGFRNGWVMCREAIVRRFELLNGSSLTTDEYIALIEEVEEE